MASDANKTSQIRIDRSSGAVPSSSSTPQASRQVSGKGAKAAVPPKPIFPQYTFRRPPGAVAPNVFYIRDHQLANNMVSLLRSPVGFDTEWKPVFTKGTPANHTALIQLADENTILLIQIKAMRYFPEKVHELFQNPEIVKVGCGIRGDATKLNRELQLRFNSLLDLGHFAKAVDPETWSHRTEHSMAGLAALCETYLQRSLIKGKITKSNWEMIPMTQAMQDYAANDAHSSVMIYQRLAQIHAELEFPPRLSDTLFGVDTASSIEDELLAQERRRARRERQLQKRVEKEQALITQQQEEAAAEIALFLQEDESLVALIEEEEAFFFQEDESLVALMEEEEAMFMLSISD
ncbi:ribonuclease H-like protein [Calocera viscosa TUFC12733]|uniref:Ribonuclease H-like protein n=1 Tax=Calocera viscosa (strain TUFC12733) TaxID=1330018 RepID=A0A167RBD6_CALVF|nr:ribonuclease H-like protein [Calocera viscosa TUFC12733]